MRKKKRGNMTQLSLIDGCSLISNQDNKTVPKQSKLFFFPYTDFGWLLFVLDLIVYLIFIGEKRKKEKVYD